jgi:coproporphyrinogen III oxidase
MNERIRELAVQAGGHFGDGLEFAVVFGELKDLEKFAQLIVQECDRYVAEQYDEYEPWMQPGDLLKHFGVGL